MSLQNKWLFYPIEISAFICWFGKTMLLLPARAVFAGCKREGRMKKGVFMILCLLLFSFPLANVCGECLKGDCKEGFGVLVLREGYKYAGEFKDGRFDGHGTLAHYNGGKYVGGWKKGQYSGQGTLILPDGGKYVGGWKDSLPCGKGKWFRSARKGRSDKEKVTPWHDLVTKAPSTNRIEDLVSAPF